MLFKYACFISYVHSKSDKPSMMKEFVDELKLALLDELETIFEEDLFIDQDVLTGGTHFNEALALALCQSFFMVVVYVPKYENHPFCLKEFRAMELLERKRLQIAGRTGQYGMIVPIVLRGVEDLPDDIKSRIHYLDFSKYTTASSDIRKNPQYVEQIKQLAKEMGHLYRAFKHLDPCKDCDQFKLPDDAAITPFRAAGKSPPSPFPGAEGAK